MSLQGEEHHIPWLQVHSGWTQAWWWQSCSCTEHARSRKLTCISLKWPTTCTSSLKTTVKKTAPLCGLVHKNVVWSWTDVHQQAFNKLKEEQANPPVLKFFDPVRPVDTCPAQTNPSHNDKVLRLVEALKHELLASRFTGICIHSHAGHGNKIHTDWEVLIAVFACQLWW